MAGAPWPGEDGLVALGQLGGAGIPDGYGKTTAAGPTATETEVEKERTWTTMEVRQSAGRDSLPPPFAPHIERSLIGECHFQPPPRLSWQVGQ